jgi:hypothetical protein
MTFDPRPFCTCVIGGGPHIVYVATEHRVGCVSHEVAWLLGCMRRATLEEIHQAVAELWRAHAVMHQSTAPLDAVLALVDNLIKATR